MALYLHHEGETTDKAARYLHAALFANFERQRHWVFWAGNGGCAAISDHMASELVTGFSTSSEVYRSYSLSANSSIISALANDFKFSEIFSRQLHLASQGDVLVILSTSGKSENLIAAAMDARRHGVSVGCIVGSSGLYLASLTNSAVVIESQVVPNVQNEMLAIAHDLCKLLVGVDNAKQ